MRQTGRQAEEETKRVHALQKGVLVCPAEGLGVVKVTGDEERSVQRQSQSSLLLQ